MTKGEVTKTCKTILFFFVQYVFRKSMYDKPTVSAFQTSTEYVTRFIFYFLRNIS